VLHKAGAGDEANDAAYDSISTLDNSWQGMVSIAAALSLGSREKMKMKPSITAMNLGFWFRV
jgi:hypothetical protein